MKDYSPPAYVKISMCSADRRDQPNTRNPIEMDT